jgi:hypothetical protein
MEPEPEMFFNSTNATLPEPVTEPEPEMFFNSTNTTLPAVRRMLVTGVSNSTFNATFNATELTITQSRRDNNWDEQFPLWIMQLCCLMLLNAILLAFYDVHKLLHNPFGNRRVDLAHEATLARLDRLARSLLEDTGSRVPAETVDNEAKWARAEKGVENDEPAFGGTRRSSKVGAILARRSSKVWREAAVLAEAAHFAAEAAAVVNIDSQQPQQPPMTFVNASAGDAESAFAGIEAI